jgi:hypothetical protein
VPGPINLIFPVSTLTAPGAARQKAVTIMTDLARGPLGALLPAISSGPRPVPFPRADPGHSPSQLTALDRSQTEQWESEGGAGVGDPDPLPHLILGTSVVPRALRHDPVTYDQKLEWTRLAFAAAQARWEARPQVVGPVTRDDEAEEPASKAAGNRARVAFLSIKGATMQGWLAHSTAGTVRPGGG